MTTIKVLEFLFGFVANLWLYAAFIIFVVRVAGGEPYQSIRTIFHELKPFYLPSTVIGYIFGSTYRERDGWDIVFFAVAVLSYWLYKNVDKDDRWQKRKEKLLEKVAQVGAKLAIVPT